MNKITTGILLSSVCSIALLAGANNKYEITPKVGIDIHQDNHEYYKDREELVYGISAGKRVFDNTIFELEYQKERGVKYSNSIYETDRDRVGVNALFEHSEYKKIVPYIIAGVGYEWIDNERNELESGKYLNVGLGVRYALQDNFHLKLEAKEVLNENGRADFVALLGLTFAFGEYRDLTPIEPEIKPIKKEVIELPPAPPAPIEVVDIDSDGDGVLDSKDLCPNTPKKFKVDSDGCPERYNLLVHFDFDKSVIKNEFKENVEDFAKFLSEYTIYDAVIEGHTDWIGDEKYNQKLSVERADSVKNYLIDLGVDDSRVSSKGYGESMPIADNQTSEGRYQNRRVEVQIIKK